MKTFASSVENKSNVIPLKTKKTLYGANPKHP